MIVRLFTDAADRCVSPRWSGRGRSPAWGSRGHSGPPGDAPGPGRSWWCSSGLPARWRHSERAWYPEICRRSEAPWPSSPRPACSCPARSPPWTSRWGGRRRSTECHQDDALVVWVVQREHLLGVSRNISLIMVHVCEYVGPELCAMLPYSASLSPSAPGVSSLPCCTSSQPCTAAYPECPGEHEEHSHTRVKRVESMIN